MSDHDRIRSLLALQVGAGQRLGRDEQAALDAHLAQCAACRTELANLRAVAAGLKAIPLPQPSLGLARRTHTRIAAELAAREQRRQQHRLLAMVIAFAWVFTALTLIVSRFLVADVAPWLGISPAAFMTVFISYTVFSVTASLAMAGLLATRHRRERRLI